MSILKQLSGLLLIMVIVVSCNDSDKVKVEKTGALAQEVAVNLKKVSLDIDGMTCEIGCARTIQSKLSKTEGVKLAQVDFSNRKGFVEYDANVISKKEIIAAVEKIADGDLYKVTNTSDKE